MATLTKSITDYECHFYIGFTNDFAHRYDELYEILDATEKQKANSFKFEKDKKLYVVAHGMLRVLIGSYINCNPLSIVFINDHSGKPYVSVNAKKSNLQFSLSHSVDCFVIAIVLNDAIGADVESIVPGSDNSVISDNYFSIAEKEQLQNSDDKDKLFYLLWTQKEAMGKVSGVGVTDIPHIQLPPGYELYSASVLNYQYTVCYPAGKRIKIFPFS